jgi:hypothetical protein
VFGTIEEVCTKSFNPYLAAEAFLYMVSGLNENNVGPDSVTSWGLSTTMPDIPKTLLERLGWVVSDSPPASTGLGSTGMTVSDTPPINPRTAFRDGFAVVIAGRQSDSVNNDGDWNGIFEDGGIEEFKAFHENYEGNKVLQPDCANISSIAQIGDRSVWDLINGHCDPSMNDIFTDILYESDTDGNIMARPAIFVRGKPFRTVAAEKLVPWKEYDGLDVFMDSWTLYDDVPRVRVDSTLITTMNISNSSTGLSNYLRAEYTVTGELQDQSQNKEICMIEAARFEGSMRRFGGQQFSIQSRYYNAEDPRLWAAGKVWLGASWELDAYRTASGSITVKDYSLPVSVGMNIQFTVGKYELVAHVEQVAASFIIDEAGNRYSSQTIGFSRLMAINPATDELDFLPPGAFADIFDVIAAKSMPAPSVEEEVLADANGAVAGFLAETLAAVATEDAAADAANGLTGDWLLTIKGGPQE